jgi:putative ABC transport system substrate-binding protein
MAQAIVPEVLLLAPDVIVVNAGNPVIAALQRATGSIPIVFANMTDPVGAGFVSSLARPGGNITGFTPFEYGISVKWLELLKEIDPRVQRVGVLRDPSNPTGIGMLAAMQGVAPTRGIELVPLGISLANDVENVIAGFAREKGGGLVVTLNGMTIAHRKLISAAALKHQLAAVYPMRYFAADGGLLSYGPNSLEPFEGVAAYVDRILKGENPADLPVQAPNKFETVVNLKTAKALGLTIPQSILATADVIE